MSENIYPTFERMLTREEHERLTGTRGVMLWFTGLSGSGKSTLAIALEHELARRGLQSRLLDGDNLRTGVNAGLGFSAEDRFENVLRTACVGRLFVDSGIITMAALVSPTNDLREMARTIIGPADFREIYVATPLAECERRDVKGLYARARRGEVKDFTGISAPFEAPEHPDLVLDTGVLTIDQSIARLLRLLGLEA